MKFLLAVTSLLISPMLLAQVPENAPAEITRHSCTVAKEGNTDKIDVYIESGVLNKVVINGNDVSNSCALNAEVLSCTRRILKIDFSSMVQIPPDPADQVLGIIGGHLANNQEAFIGTIDTSGWLFDQETSQVQCN